MDNEESEGAGGLECSHVHFSRHAIERMFQRGVSPQAVRDIVDNGEVIAQYPDDKPYPSTLLLGYCGNIPVHTVVARDGVTGGCFVVTVYRPNPQRWDDDYRNRRES